MSHNTLARTPLLPVTKCQRSVAAVDGRFSMLASTNACSRQTSSASFIQAPLDPTPTFGAGPGYVVTAGAELLNAYWKIPTTFTSITMPSAAVSVAAIKAAFSTDMPLPGASFEITIDNTANAASVVLTAGAGWTVTNGTVAAGDLGRFSVVVTDPTVGSETLIATRSNVALAGGVSPYSSILGTAANYVIMTGQDAGPAANFTVTTANTIDLASGDLGHFGATQGLGAVAFGSGSDTGVTGLVAATAEVITAATTLAAATPFTAFITPGAFGGGNYGFGLGVFVPGVYKGTDITTAANSTLTLSGAGDYVFVVTSAGGSITFGANTNILLTNGAVASRVYWVTGALSSGSTSNLVGNFLVTTNNAGTGIVGNIGSTNTLQGRLLTGTLGGTSITIDGTASSFNLPVA